MVQARGLGVLGEVAAADGTGAARSRGGGRRREAAVHVGDAGVGVHAVEVRAAVHAGQVVTRRTRAVRTGGTALELQLAAPHEFLGGKRGQRGQRGRRWLRHPIAKSTTVGWKIV